MKPRGIFSLFGLCLFASLLFAQRADRATISGIITDPTGNNIPGATVKIRNQNTSVETVLTSNDSGAYT